MELITMIAAAFIGIFLTTSLTSDILTIPILQMILMLYLYIGLVAGWNYINEQKKIAFYFSTIPLLGFLLKIISASILGLFITPFRIKNKISRLKQIHLIETID